MADREKVIAALEKACRDSVELPPFVGRIEITKEAIEEGILPLLREQVRPGWISVKDRLPEIGQTCLIYGKGKFSVAKHIAHAEWITPGIFPVVTYWMPLPEDPKEVQE